MNMRRILFAAALAFIPVSALAQAPVQQNSQRLDAASLAATNATSAATLTLTPPAGQYVYVTAVEITNCASAGAVTAAAVTTLTTTGFNGVASGPIWTLASGLGQGTCVPEIIVTFPSGLKSATPGTAVTFVQPTWATNQVVRLNVYYYFSN